jgi:dTDP-4-amino-4,6-dideoxygalactose transaminase
MVAKLNVPITRPLFGPEEAAAIALPLETGWIVQGPQVAEFERLFCELSGSPHSLATTSCTTALHLALAVLGIGAGHEVVVPAFTYVASANVVEQSGAQTVFCDIDPTTYNVDPASLERAITPRTKAIMPVHLFGLVADMPAVTEIAGRHGLAVVEDAACAVGSTLNGVHAGTFGDFGAFSFHARKPITTGEGGMLTIRDDGHATRATALRSHGGLISDLERHLKGSFALPEHDEVGFNYRMTDFQGALGVVQMGRLPAVLEARRHFAERYSQSLGDLPGLTTPVVPPGAVHTYQSYVVRIDPDEAALGRDDLALELQARGIATRQGTHAVHMLGYFKHTYGHRPEDFPNAFDADATSLSLPLFPSMSDEEHDYVIDNLHELLR